MDHKINRIAYTGNMDKDSDVRYVGKGNNAGDGLDARNIQAVDTQGNVQGSIPPTLGNEFAFSLGEVSPQNKRFRITFDGDVTKQHELRFLSTQRDANMVVGTGTDGALSFNGTRADFITQFGIYALPGLFSLTNIGTDSVEIELLAYPMYQWYLDSIGVDDVTFVVTQEAIPVDLAGPLKDIGSYDLLGDLFIFSTTQDNEPTELSAEINGVGPVSGGVLVGPLTTLSFNAPHGLVAGQWIRITRSLAPWLNGTFVVQQVLSTTQIAIPTVLAWGGTQPLFTVGSEQTFINPTGIGEIGVAQKNDNTDTWTYTRLLRSVELNFVSRHIVRSDARKKNQRTILYFTDNYNNIRFFSYRGAYVQDGGLNFINPDNNLVYGFIAQGTSVMSRVFNIGSKISFIAQTESGGLTAGNKYYAYQFLDQYDNSSSWSDIAGPVSVYSRSPSVNDPITIKGNVSGTVTSKANTLEISDIPIGIFPKIRIAVIEAVDNIAISGVIFNEVAIPPNASAVTITHTGIETDSTAFDVAELTLAPTSGSIDTAKDITIIDRRLVMANLTYKNFNDLSEFARTATHHLEYSDINGIGNYNTPSYKKFGGYLDPQNIFNSPSLTLNETYRAAMDFVFVDGTVSSSFWVDDIKIDTSVTNTANPTDNRRVAPFGLTDYALNIDSASLDYPIRVPVIVFSGLNPNYLINGVPANQLIASVRFRFSKIIREVLASGVVLMGTSGNKTTPLISSGAFNMVQEAGASIIPYQNWNDEWVANNVATNIIPNIGSSYPQGFIPERSFGAFYSPEVSMGKLDNFSLTSSDKIIIYYPVRKILARLARNVNVGNAVNGTIDVSSGTPFTNGNTAGTRMYESSVAMTIMHPALTAQGTASDLLRSQEVRTESIQSAQIMTAGQDAVIGGQNFSTRLNERIFGTRITPLINESGTAEYTLSTAKCLVVETAQDMYPADGITGSGVGSGVTYWSTEDVDKGMYYAQIFRDTPNKYGDLESSVYESLSTSFDMLDILNAQTLLPVKGGDSFSVGVPIRQRFNETTQEGTIGSPGAWPAVTDYHQSGRHIGLIYMTQSYMNMELVNVDPGATEPSFPEDYVGTNYFVRLNRWSEDSFRALPIQGEYIQFYNEQYSYQRNMFAYPSYDASILRFTRELRGRITWSLPDIYSSIDDSMTIFLPLNIMDLDTTWGDINVAQNVNGELFTAQPRKFQLQRFNERGVLQSDVDGVSVLLGSGDVLSVDGKTLSFYGTSHQLSSVKGRSEGGKDVFFWYNAENGLFMRFGADGTLVISNRNNFRSYANKAAKWIRGKDTPAYDQGIRCVWDDRSKEVIWTFTGWREVNQAWTNGAFVEVGEVVTNTNAPFDTYEQLPRFFRCILVHTASPATEAGVGADWETYWEAIAYDDFNYYSVFTVAFNEATNGFKTFYGHIPKTYLKWGDTFLSSHPVHRNLIFEHRRGLPTTWYGVDSFLTGTIAPKVEDAYVEMVVNDVPEQTTRGIAVRYLSDNIPDRVDYRTKRHHTWDEAAQFRQDGDQWTAPIRKDATVTGTPVQGGDILTGEYLRVKFTIFGGTYNLLHSIVVKYLDKARRINR